jgi:predicted RNase H-like nuclease (RuvC/YqgF family)
MGYDTRESKREQLRRLRNYKNWADARMMTQRIQLEELTAENEKLKKKKKKLKRKIEALECQIALLVPSEWRKS